MHTRTDSRVRLHAAPGYRRAGTIEDENGPQPATSNLFSDQPTARPRPLVGDIPANLVILLFGDLAANVALFEDLQRPMG